MSSTGKDKDKEAKNAPLDHSETSQLSFSTEKEISAWRRFQSNRVAYPDLLSLLDSKFQIPNSSPETIPTEIRSFLKADEISDNLKQRFKQKLAYTSIGQQFLIYVNLNDRISKKKEKEKEYKKKKDDAVSFDEDDGFLLLSEEEKALLINDPRANHIVQEHNHAHVFTFASRVYWHMLREKEDQVIITSGESGSGKSENVKLVIKQLAHLSSSYAWALNKADNRMANRLFCAIQLLELFGNAKTPLNPNSSRLHKYIEMQFSKGGKLVGAKILDFLLEKRRIVQGVAFAKQERNFHIFYELFATGQLTREEKERVCLLDTWRSYKYLTPSNKAKNFKHLDKYVDVDFATQGISIKNVLRSLGFGVKSTEEILKLVSCTMLLGNLEFAVYEAKKEDGAYVKNTDVLEKCALLLGVSPEALGTTLTQRTVTTGGTICADFLTIEQAKKQRDLFAITIYSLLFDHLVASVNKRINADNMDSGEQDGPNVWENWISLFDFGGVETITVLQGAEQEKVANKYWQFMTNFADEKIHSFMRSKVFAFTEKVHNSCNDLLYSVDKVQEEGDNWINGLMRMYIHPVSGLLMQLDTETITLLNEENTPVSNNNSNDTLKDENIAADLIKTFNKANQVQAKRQTIFGRTFSEAVDSRAEAYYLVGSNKSFGVKHYGGATSNSHNTYHFARKIYYDVSEFIASNKLGGKGRGSQGLKADFVRLIKGTADFTSSKNSYLVSLIDKHAKLMVHPREKRVILTAVKKESGLSRIPSQRKKKGDKQLSTAESGTTPRDILKNRFMSYNSKTSAHSPLDSKSLKNEQTGISEKSSPTVSSEFYSDLNNVLLILSESEQCRFWNLVCVKPNDDLNEKKFNEERVKEQLRRRDVPVFLLNRVGELSKSFTYKDFYARYSVLEVKGEKNDDSSADANSILKNKVKKIYEMYGIITGGGNGKVVATDDAVYMNERTYWALERNLVGIELKNHQITEEDVVIKDIAEEEEHADKSVDIDNEQKVLEKRRKMLKRQELTTQRLWWLRITKFMTWWIPDAVIKTVFKHETPDVIQAWREKVALCFLICLLTGIMLFMITGFGILLCPPSKIFSKDDLSQNFADQNARKNYMDINGYVFDVAWFPGTLPGHPQTVFYDYAGKDASVFFPHSSNIPECSGFGKIAKRAVQIPSVNGGTTTPSTSSSNTVTGASQNYSVPTVSQHVFENFLDSVLLKKVTVTIAGKFAIPASDVAARKSGTSVQYIIIDKNVYDVTAAIKQNVFGTDISTAFDFYAGQDMSSQKSLLGDAVMQCLQKRFFIGVVDDRNNLQCTAAGDTLLILTVILLSVMAAKFLAALQLGARRLPEETERYTIIQIPCYTEGEDSLRKTIRSCALLDYADDKKLLFIIADGLIKGSGNDRMTPEIVLDVLGVENSHEKLTSDAEVPRYDYIALGDGMNRLNRAKIFSGFTTVETRKVPYIVVVKCGKESETRRPGNRGKRDSQLIMMKFLNKVHFDREMMPLELEMYRQIKNVIGVDPALYEYCLMVDADTEVLQDSLNRLISVFCHDSLIMGLCGETQIGNEQDSFITMIQVYEYYISHHLAKAFESLFGSVTCLPGCFCMYRIRSPGRKPQPLLIDDRVIHDYEENNVDTLHKKNLLSLGEDRYLTTLMLKTFPGFRNKFTPDAACKTIVPDKFSVLLSQRRRWINSTIHNLWELLLVPELCGCLCFSMRLVVFLDLFATLTMPGSIAYLGYLIYEAVAAQSVFGIAESLYLFAAIYGCQAFIFLIKRKFDMIGWMVIYIFSLPVYGFFLPAYAFWNFDDFSWGNTRLVVGEGRGGHVAEDMEEFDEKKVPLLKWSDKDNTKRSKKPDVIAPIQVAKTVKTDGQAVVQQRKSIHEVDITDEPVRVQTADPTALDDDEIDQLEEEFERPPSPAELPYVQQPPAVQYAQSMVSQYPPSVIYHPSVVAYPPYPMMYPPQFSMYGPPQVYMPGYMPPSMYGYPAGYYPGYYPPPDGQYINQPEELKNVDPVTPLSAQLTSPVEKTNEK